MSEHRWIKFWPQDWIADSALRCCGAAARGVWMDILCIMHDASPYGHLTISGRPVTTRQLGTITGVGESGVAELLDELEDAGVFSRTDEGTIFSRRMVRDNENAALASESGKKGGNPYLRRGAAKKDDRARPYKKSDSPQKTMRIFHRNGGCCWWCKTPLQVIEPGPDFFTVSHIVQVSDGGTIDEDNLVPSCSDCNNKRAIVVAQEPETGHEADIQSRYEPETEYPTLTPPPLSDPNPPLNYPLYSDSKHQEDRRENQSTPLLFPPEGEAPRDAQRKERKEAARKRKIPEDWKPTEAGLAFADKRGHPRDGKAIGHFRDHHLSKGTTMLDWDAAWRTWVMNGVERFGRKVTPQQPPPRNNSGPVLAVPKGYVPQPMTGTW